MLESLRADIGLPAGSRLSADLHSVLLYEPGQFFLPHQDSEKSDDMVATLVVMLPSASKGGELVIEHAGRSETYRASGTLLTFVAFYADCLHEVRPLTSGHRIALTYNLRLNRASQAADADPDSDVTLAVGRTLIEHFETQNRLVYLLDHEYTQRGLTWERLKGADVARVTALRSGAQSIGCDLILAPADIHETRDCIVPYRSQRRPWYGDEEDDEPEDYELGDLLDGSVTLAGAVGPAQVADDEMCATTPSDQLTPYDSQYEGYMGNYGNTMDRWYRRGAVVVWPRERDFAVRAEGSPAWALEELARRVEDGTAREAAATLEPFWQRDVSRSQPGPDDPELGCALDVAAALGEPELATMLLGPFVIEDLACEHAASLVAVADVYGTTWLRDLVERWNINRRWHQAVQRADWVGGIAALCAEIGDPGVARVLLDPAWRWLQTEVERIRTAPGPSRRANGLDRLVASLANILMAGVTTGATRVTDAAVEMLNDDELASTTVAVLRHIDGVKYQTEPFAALVAHMAGLLEARLALPVRRTDDWSVDRVGTCRRSECAEFALFLADSSRLTFEWKLAEAGRVHIEHEIATQELPVRHETRKLGRPYTLVLTKTSELFEREARVRERDERDVNWLRDRMPTG